MSDLPDLAHAIDADRIEEGAPFAGCYDGQKVLLVRTGDAIRAISAECTHAGAPLEDGIVADGTIRCPWHHARFSLDSGDATSPPAFQPLGCFEVEQADGKVRITGKRTPSRGAAVKDPGRVVIVGAGGAGFTLADHLHRAGFGATVTLLSADVDAPYDRTMCSKEYLSGEMERGDTALSFAADGDAPDLRTGTRVSAIDPDRKEVRIEGGEPVGYDVLVLATGAEPMRPDFPGSDGDKVHVLRTLADADRIVEAAGTAKRAVILGASFIGLEAAASLVQRGVEVEIVERSAIPLASLLGDEVGRKVRAVHEEKGEVFHLEREIERFNDGEVVLDDGTRISADMLVIGAGVKPRDALAREAGLDCVEKGGVAVDGFLKTSVPDIYAIGDIAQYPNPRLGRDIRVEHWVHAGRQGAYLARLLTGRTDKPFGDTPYFWSTHHDLKMRYVGHAGPDAEAQIDGDLGEGDFSATYRDNGKAEAAIFANRDVEALKREAEWERPYHA